MGVSPGGFLKGVLPISAPPPALTLTLKKLEGLSLLEVLGEDLLATGVGIRPWPKIGAYDSHGVLRAETAGQAGSPGRHVHDFCRRMESTREVRAS